MNAEDVTVGGCIVRLSALADDLGTLAAALNKVEQESQEVEIAYENHVADFEAGMFEAWENDEGKWPGEKTRERLARRTMDSNLKRNYDRLYTARKRGDKRIASLKAEADAVRSVLSALKEELAATR